MSVRQPAPRTYNASDYMHMDTGMKAVDHLSPEEADLRLGQGAVGYTNSHVDRALNRKILVSVRASLADLQNNSTKGTWTPSTQAVKNMLQHKQFVSLSGAEQMQGDLSSVIVHSVSAVAARSSFPVALGAKITGVDETTFSGTGNSYSMIVMPGKTDSTQVLQRDDVSIARDFAAKYPGYTAANLETNGVHKVPQRRFALVSSDHPLVTAIQENQDQLQAHEITQMPEQMVKISESLYNTMMPLVKEQVASQIKVCDMSKMAVRLEPADFSGWGAVGERLVAEESASIIERRDSAIRALPNIGAGEQRQLMELYDDKLKEVESRVYHSARDVMLELSLNYNFLNSGADASKGS